MKLADAAYQYLLWVKNGHGGFNLRCPLCPRKQTSLSAITMSANSERISRLAAHQQIAFYFPFSLSSRLSSSE
jgi:hypothetical protein